MNSNLLLKLVKGGIYVVPVSVLFYWQKTIFPFITVKIFFFFVFTEILVLLWIWLFWKEPKYRPQFSRLHLLILGFFVVMGFSAFFGVNVARSFWSTPARAIGLVALFHFYALFLVLTSIRKKINWRRYLSFLFWLSVVGASSAFFGRFFPEIFFNVGGERPGGILGNPAFLGSYLLISLFLGLWLAHTELKGRPWYGWVLYAGVLFEVLAIFLGNTRGAIIGLAVGLTVVLIYIALRGYRAKYPLAKNFALILLIVLIVFGGAVWMTRQVSVWQNVPGLDRIAQISLSDTTTNNRLIAWQIAFDSFLEKPISGWGFENFRYAFDARYEPTLLRSGFSETYWDKPHNIFLEMLVTGGVLGFGLFLAILVMSVYIVLKKTPKNFRPYGLGLLIAYAVSGLVTFDTFGSYLMLFIVFAFLYHSEREGNGSVAGSVGTVRLRSALAVAGTLVVVFLIIINSKTLYANSKYYDGLNYYIQRYPEEGFVAFEGAMAVNHPYLPEIKAEFLSVITQMIQQFAIPEDPRVHIDEALRQYPDAIKSDPNYYFYHSRLADAKTVFFRIDSQYLAGAWEDIGRAQELSPNRQQNHYITSKIKLLEGDSAGALAEMQKAIDLDPLVGEPHLYHGLLQLQISTDPVALDEIRKALDLGRQPKNAQEARLLGGYFGDAEDYEMAEYFFEYAVQLDPGEIEGRAKLAIVYFYNGKFDESKELFEGVLEDLAEDWYQSEHYLSLKPILDQLGL